MHLVERAMQVVANEERILAAWLVGSLATNNADASSDVDLHCLITDDSARWFRDNWPQLATQIAGPLVLADALPGVIGGLALTESWLHLDLIMHPRSDLDPRTIRGMAPLFDRTGDLLPAAPVPVEPWGEPFFPQWEVRVFLYHLGNLPIGLERGELIHTHGAIFTWRDLLVQLMLAENGVRDRGGPKRLNPFLRPEQRRFLESIPAAAVHVPEILDALRVIAGEFIRRGTALAARTAAVWPQSLQDAAEANIARHLGTAFVLDS